ncbi:hypothetical protein BZA77DRAFT_49794 [Pyronema omphalodes]|nr:hypothetical protein BZA77DRAFT_49794 [Pyronema omphalodes]
MVRRWFSVSKPPKIVRSSRIGVDNIFLMLFFLCCVGEIIFFGPIYDFLDGSIEAITSGVSFEMSISVFMQNYSIIRQCVYVFMRLYALPLATISSFAYYQC